MKEKVTRRLLYRRAIWKDNQRRSLESLIRDAHTQYPNVEDRVFPYRDDTQIEGMSLPLPPSGIPGIVFHAGKFDPGSPTAVIDLPGRFPSQDTKQVGEPENQHYLLADVYCLIVENHVIVCCSNCREGFATYYIRALLNKSGRDDLIDQLLIRDAHDADTSALIREHGIDSIGLNTAAFQQTLDRLNDEHHQHIHNVNSLVNRIRERMDEVTNTALGVGEDLSREEKAALSSMKVTVKFDVLRSKFNADVVEHELERVAEELLEDPESDDAFVIYLHNGPTIRPSQVRMSKPVEIKSLANSIEPDSVIRELATYYEELRRHGKLEQ